MVRKLSKPMSDLPTITREQLAAEEARTPRPMVDSGRRLKCPSCGKRTFEWTNALERTIPKPGLVVVLKHLTGFRCHSCKAEALDDASSVDLAREQVDEQLADYALALTKQGDRRAIFLNQDLMRVARPDEVDEVIIAPVNRDNWLVRLIRRGRREEHAPSPPQRKPIRSDAR